MYFDYAAGAPIKKDVIDLISDNLYTFQESSNPHSAHSYGRQANFLVRKAEKIITKLDKDILGLSSPQYFWTGSGTQANIIALQSYLTKTNEVLLCNQLDHKSVTQIGINNNSNIVYPGKDGLLRFPSNSIYESTIISICTVHPETGALFSKSKFNELIEYLNKSPKIQAIHFDMIQGSGSIGPEEIKLLESMNYELLITRSSHKIGGPPGLGVIITNNINNRILYTGTPSQYMIDAYGYAYNSYCIDGVELELRKMVRDFIDKENLSNEFKIAEFDGVEYVENIVPIKCIDQDGLMLAMEADTHGVQFSTGSACNKNGVSPTYEALYGDKAKSIIRLSGPKKVNNNEEVENVKDKISYLFEVLEKIKMYI